MPSYVHARRWRRQAASDDDGSLHALGNGRLLAYGRGPDLIQVWGPHYTSGNLVSLELHAPAGLESVSSREAGSAIWQHRLTLDGVEVGVITDLVDRDLPCLVRRLTLTAELRIAIHLADALPPSATRHPGRTTLAAIHPPGVREYGRRFRTVAPQAVEIVLGGQASLAAPAAEGQPWLLTCALGTSELLIAAGPEYPDAVQHAEAALGLGWDALLTRTRAHWAATLATMTLPKDLPADITSAAADTAVILAVQQSQEGCIIAGHHYCLAYVRDQYGCSRALLALGLHERARDILGFYWRIWQREGRIHNAQSVGPATRFHVHENDDVELTGWLVVQAFDYLAATGDEAFVAGIEPMLTWAQDLQERQLVEGMLPFNGDETYIAGGMVPRLAIDHGSAEATLLCLAGGERLSAWQEHRRSLAPDLLAGRRARLDEVRRRYRQNFFDGARLLVNAPARAAAAATVLPRFRHGVCQIHGAGCRFMDWIERRSDGRYACPVCFPLAEPPAAPPPRLYLPSVATTPAFIHQAIASPAEQQAMLDAAIAPLTTADGRIALPPTGAPGYELGFLLYALAEAGDARCAAVADHLLGLRDPTGAWVEYYRDGRATGCRYRPWESAINLCGLLRSAGCRLPAR